MVICHARVALTYKWFQRCYVTVLKKLVTLNLWGSFLKFHLAHVLAIGEQMIFGARKILHPPTDGDVKIVSMT